jgi:putative effector of murein hydrolase LrgA (UPF0299 family)
MASFIESLKQANVDQLVTADHLEMVKGGHWTLPISAVVIVMAVLFFLIGLGTWNRSKLKQGGLFALLGAVVGWASSYLTHTATASAAGNTNAPATSKAAQEIAYAAVAPTTAAIAVMLLCGLAMMVVKEKKKDGKGGGQKPH